MFDATTSCALWPSIRKSIKVWSDNSVRFTVAHANNCEPSACRLPPRRNSLAYFSSGPAIPKTRNRVHTIKLPLTHEEIAEFIGTTRETVTRTLSEFKNRNLVALQGSTLMISNRPALETIGGA